MDRRERQTGPTRFTGRLQVLGPRRDEMSCAIDFGAGGTAQATAPRHVRVGAPVMIQVQGEWLAGEVVQCRSLLEGYTLSLHLHDDSIPDRQ